MLDHSWLWQNKDLSDVKVCLVVSEAPKHTGPAPECDGEPAAKRARIDNRESREDSASKLSWLRACLRLCYGTRLELPLHAAVLGSASGYWKARVLRWRNDVASSATTARCVLEETFNSAAEVEAARNILQHAYTGKLPDAVAVPLLMQMAILADKWDMPHALAASLAQAATVKQLSVDDLNWLLRDGLPESITAHAAYTPLYERCTTKLLRLYGRAQIIMAEPDQLQSFCSLSLRAVQLWAEQDLLTVDSENTIAVLFTHWWDKNSGSFCEQQKAAAATALTEALRVSHLSQSFLLVVDNLPWFRPSKEAASILQVLYGTPFQDQSDYVKSQLPAGWARQPHANDEQQVSTIQYAFTRAELEKLHRDAAHNSAKLMFAHPLYWRGYRWQPALFLVSQKGDLSFGVYFQSAAPDGYAAATPPVLPAEFELLVHTSAGPKKHQCNFGRTRPVAAYGRGCATLLGVPEATTPRSHSFPPDSVWKDGKLHLEVIMKELW